ncbi:MAG: 1-deoxy-D-xylulose-5-phosphate reductoisomerase [Holosporales bacterium]|jgi:1-deoxy-D-xylulose-5-phosphate reductoisomerase|nr:1-deoxy-D-xylulose-5-phosphate reductoisomerase [Holosporales bacterium]
MKKISILGSTGKIGEKAVEIAKLCHLNVVAISGHNNYDKLLRQVNDNDLAPPPFVCVTTDEGYLKVRDILAGRPNISVLPPSEIDNIARLEVDCCVMAISGNAAVSPVFASLGHAKRLAIANKESIVSGGKLLIDTAIASGTEIIPIDSEHNAIFQCLAGENIEDVAEIILTASGGPFLDLEEESLGRVTVADALRHPKWDMGRKITVDSATLINKALEIIEASYLFAPRSSQLPIKKIRSLLHPDSVIHGLVKFKDGVIKAAMSVQDMKLPISFAINYPERQCHTNSTVDFEQIGKLTFKRPTMWQKRNIDLAYTAHNEKKVIALNVANEIAVARFLSGQINFNEIYHLIVDIMNTANPENITSKEDIFEAIRRVRAVFMEDARRFCLL